MIHESNAPVKLFCPHPPGTPVDITFIFGCLGLFITLFLYFPPYSITVIHSFSSVLPFLHFIFQCPPFFITHIFPLTPGLPEGIGAEQFDWRNDIRKTLNKKYLGKVASKEA